MSVFFHVNLRKRNLRRGARLGLMVSVLVGSTGSIVALLLAAQSASAEAAPSQAGELPASTRPARDVGTRGPSAPQEKSSLPAKGARAGAKHAAPQQLSDAELEKRVHTDIESLGSLSIGLPNNGRLLNGVKAEDGALFEVVAPDFCYGTEEALTYLERAVRVVHETHPNTPPLHVGHISSKSGGHLSPHLSHQSGRDMDLGFYYSSKRAWYRRPTNATLDVERTWTLVRALITETDVELILVDSGIQLLLRQHAMKVGEDKDWLARIFKGSPERPPIIRHARGHATHLHVRFFSPEAQRNGQRAYPYLVDEELVSPVVIFAHHKVRKGETLGRIAKNYGTTVKAIQQANGMRGTVIQARKVYKIPRAGGPEPVVGELTFPTRQVP